MSFLSRLFGGAPQGPRIVVHEAHGGAIRVFETPTGPGWLPSEDARKGDGFTARTVKYMRSAPPAPLALLAKIYSVEAGDPPPDPKSTDWRAAFQALFASIASVDVRDSNQLTMKSAIPGVEAIIDGLGKEPAVPLRVRERRAVVGREQFIVTAFGTAEAFDAFAADIERWFSTAAFVPRGD